MTNWRTSVAAAVAAAADASVRGGSAGAGVLALVISGPPPAVESAPADSVSTSFVVAGIRSARRQTTAAAMVPIRAMMPKETPTPMATDSPDGMPGGVGPELDGDPGPDPPEPEPEKPVWLG